MTHWSHKTFYKNEEDATAYYLDMITRKKNLGGKYNEKALDNSYDDLTEEDEIDEDDEQ